MAKYPAVITTMAGTNTIAEANASKQALIFTKIVIGAGDMPASIPRATALTDKRLELAITKSVKTGDGQFMVQGLLSNKNLDAGFYAREIGLMAKAGENGQEVLFSYTNGGNYVDYIPDKNTPMDSYTFTITTVVGNAEKVQAIVSDNGVASVHDLEAHNTDEHAHDERFNKYLPTAGGTVTGNVKFNNASVGFNNGNNTYDAKIRIASNGNFDIGVTEDAANKNATPQLLLHSQNKPKWYNSTAGGKDIALVEDINNAITAVDNDAALSKVPRLQLVKTLLSGLNIKNATDVIDALETNKASGLGIRYDFSNPNAWYICLGKLFGNLIIQGGNNLVRGNKEAFITLPISYSKFFIPVSNPEYDAIRKFNINMVSMYSGGEGLNKVHLTTDVWGDSDVDKEIYCWWLTVGI
nr:MAG TPA: tail-collar fiber protein [Caudoviricetes sp.]